MKTHLINIPFLVFNAVFIATGLGNTAFHILAYVVQAYFYIVAIKSDQQLARLKRENP